MLLQRFSTGNRPFAHEVAGISKLYYAAAAEDTSLFGGNPGALRREVGKPMAERALANEQLMAEEGRALLLEWAGMQGG